MTESDALGLGIGSIFDKITKNFDDVGKKTSKEDDMIGKFTNRKLEKPWNIKIQLGVEFFTETFKFIKEMGYDVVLDVSPKELTLMKLDPSTSHLTYIKILKTEMSEYINTDVIDISVANYGDVKEPETKSMENLIYVYFDILDEISLNPKYPIDIYFDTKKEKRMYIVNGKNIESRRLEDTSVTDNPSLNLYRTNYFDKMLSFMKHESTVDITVSHVAFKNILNTLAKKQTKDKKTNGILDIRFGSSDITFLIGNDTQSSDLQMYGDDIAMRGSREIQILMHIDHIVKFGKLEFTNNVILHINETLPRIFETRFGAGNIKLYYLIAPRVKEED